MGNKGSVGGRKFAGFGASLAFALLLALMLALGSGGGQAAASAAYTAYSHQITITATGGECASVGSWDQYSKSCTLNTDISDTTVWLVSSGVTLNGNSHLTGAGPDVHFGAIVGDNTTGVTVENLSASGFTQSGRYSNDDYGGYGIYIKPTSSGNTLASDTVTTCNNGIGVDGSNNTLSGNNVSSNNFYGIILNGSGNSLSGNTASSNHGPQFGVGIAINGASSILTANTVDSNPGSGIVVNGSSSGDNISGNTVDANGLGEGTNPASGIQLNGNNEVVENNIAENNFSGIFATGGGDTITGNTASSNRWGGITSAGSSLSNSTISGNTTASNSSNGISLYNSSGDTVTGNNTSSNGSPYSGNPGMSLAGISDSTISNNVSSNSSGGGTGISIGGSGWNCNYNDVIQSNATDADDSGIRIDNTSCGNTAYAQDKGLNILDNSASNNKGAYSDGFSLYNLNGAVISGNTLSANANDGLYLGYSSGLTISGNTFSSNNGIGLNFGDGTFAATAYHNNFLNNRYQVGWGAASSVMNLPAPVGGNFWSDFNTPAQGCNDANGDGFCDSPYNSGNPDNLPLTHQVAGGKPPLSLSLPDSFWGSLSDYQLWAPFAPAWGPVAGLLLGLPVRLPGRSALGHLDS